VSSEVRINAEARTEFGKGGARRTRRAGKVPAVLYGHGTDPRHISLPARELVHAFKTDAGGNVLLRLELADGTELALPRQIQRDPLRGDFTHVDLLLVRQGEKVAVDIPVHLVGEAAGVKSGDGMLDHQVVMLHVEAEATQIPQGVDVDITGLDVGDSITAADVKLPEGVTLLLDAETTIVHVIGKQSEEALEADLAASDAETGGGAHDAPADTGTGDVVADTESSAGGPADPGEGAERPTS
jgi:large subunit ribosomal protein L25